MSVLTVEIPDPTLISQEFISALGDLSYSLKIDWKDPSSQYFLTISDLAGNILADSLPGVVNYPLFYGLQIDGLDGTLMAISQDGSECAFGDLGIKIYLLYTV